jgi:hypothetical protein
MRHAPHRLSAGLILLAVACLVPTAQGAFPQTSRPLAGAANHFTLNVDHEGMVSITITLQGGVFDSVDVQGPGSCVKRMADPGTSTFLTCGYLLDGTYDVLVAAQNGAILGRIDVDGATFALH